MSGDSPTGQGTLFQQGNGGSSPTSPLQPRELIVKVISRNEAQRIWLDKHYLHRDVPGASLELGVFSPAHELVGALCFSAWVVWAPKGGRPKTWELRRLWLDDRCKKNSESRVLRVASRIIEKIAPHVREIIAYADPDAGHKGIIYRAAGFRFCGMTSVSFSNSYGNTKKVSYSHKYKYSLWLWKKEKRTKTRAINSRK